MWARIKDGFLFGLGLFAAQAVLSWIAQLLIEALQHVQRHG